MLHAAFVDTGIFRGKLYDLGAYPGVVPSNDPNDRVRGEVYFLRRSKELLRALDEYEGCVGVFPLYRRQLATVVLNNGTQITAWIYIYNRSTKGYQVISSGDYLKFLKNKESEI